MQQASPTIRVVELSMRLRAVVDDLARPEPAYAVRAAVEDIISEIVEEEAQDPRPPPALERDPDVEQVELIGPHRHADDRRDDRRPRDLADRDRKSTRLNSRH